MDILKQQPWSRGLGHKNKTYPVGKVKGQQ